MKEDIYLHGICPTNAFYLETYETYEILCKILKCRALLSSKLQRTISNEGFNGVDYVSLCDYTRRYVMAKAKQNFNAYNTYVRYSVSLMFPQGEFEVIDPVIVKAPSRMTAKDYIKMKKLGLSNDKSFSDMPDEVQVKDRVPLEYMSGLTYPVHMVRENDENSIKKIARIMDDLDILNYALSEYGYDVPIYDIDTFAVLDSPKEVEYVLRFGKSSKSI